MVKQIVKRELSLIGMLDNLVIVAQVAILLSLGVWVWDWQFWVLVFLWGVGKEIYRLREKEEGA